MDGMSSQRTYSITACCDSPGYEYRFDVSTDLTIGDHLLASRRECRQYEDHS